MLIDDVGTFAGGTRSASASASLRYLSVTIFFFFCFFSFRVFFEMRRIE